MQSEEEIGHACIAMWGQQEQIRQTIEECAELIVKLAKYGRDVNGSNETQICEEIADVEIMCKQMRLIFNSDVIDNIKTQKLIRLSFRLAEELKDGPTTN